MHYRRHFLSRVSFQINFEIDSLKRELPESISSKCTELTGATKNMLPVFGMTVIMSKIESTETSMSYMFQGERFLVQIQSNMLHISDFKYSTHEEFHNVIIQVLQQFNLVFNRPIFSRVALRYINNINFPEGATFDYANKINEHLLNATLDFREFGLTRSIGLMNMKDDNNINVNFTYGFVNSQHPNKIVKREFLLDFDCYITVDNENIADIQPILIELRNKVNVLFDKSIRQELKQIMEPQN